VIELDGYSRVLDIMDTSGQSEYKALWDSYMRTGDGFIIVYSVASMLTFNSVSRLHTQIRRIKEGVGEVPIVLAAQGGESDEEREVSETEGQELAALLGLGYVECSPTTNHNVALLFYEVVRRIDKWRFEHYGDIADNSRKRCIVS